MSRVNSQSPPPKREDLETSPLSLRNDGFISPNGRSLALRTIPDDESDLKYRSRRKSSRYVTPVRTINVNGSLVKLDNTRHLASSRFLKESPREFIDSGNKILRMNLVDEERKQQLSAISEHFG